VKRVNSSHFINITKQKLLTKGNKYDDRGVNNEYKLASVLLYAKNPNNLFK